MRGGLNIEGMLNRAFTVIKCSFTCVSFLVSAVSILTIFPAVFLYCLHDMLIYIHTCIYHHRHH